MECRLHFAEDATSLLQERFKIKGLTFERWKRCLLLLKKQENWRVQRSDAYCAGMGFAG